MKIEYRIDRKNNKIELSQIDQENLSRILSWEQKPNFEVPGRTGWYILKEPVSVENKFVIKALKLKGIGLWNPEGRDAKEKQLEPIPPTHETYRRKSLHVGFKEDGNILRIPSEDAPYGGIVLRRARMEYDSAATLYENNVPAIIPYMVVEYPELQFQGETLGVAISACVEEKPYRLLHLGWDFKYVPEHLQEFYRQIAKQKDICESMESGIGKLKLSVLLGEQYGNAIRGLTESNLYIHSGGWDNLQYDFSKGQIFMTDLDSTRTNEKVSDKTKAICGVRDLVSCLYRFVNKLYYPKAIEVYDVSMLLEYDVMASMICGYFKDRDKELCRIAAKKIWRFYMPYFCELKGLEADLHEIPSPLRKKLKMNLDMFYLISLHYLYPIMLKSDSVTVKDCSLTVEEYEQCVKQYLGSRYEYYSLFCME